MKTKILEPGMPWIMGMMAGCLFIVCFANTTQAQVSQERQVSAFKGIENRGSVDLYINQGSSPRVIIEADESAIGKVDTWVEDGMLVIDVQGCPSNVRTLKAHVTVTDLERLVINGSGDLKTETTIQAPVLETRVNGSGNITLQIDVEKFDIRISGSGDAKIKGNVSNAYIGVSGSGDLTFDSGKMTECVVRLTGSGDIDLAGTSDMLQIKQVSSGDIDADDLITKTCIIEKSGSGDTSVNVDGDLSVVCSGSGDVYYKGNTKIKSISVSGSGDVRKIN